MDTIRYAEDIIVGTVWHGEWRWYLGEKDDWFLGWQPEFSDASLNSEIATNQFLKRMASSSVTTAELRALLADEIDAHPERDPERLIVYNPSLIIDFDSKRLQSSYPEPVFFEKHIPDDWSGKYGGIAQLVPPHEQYWMIEGRDELGIGGSSQLATELG